MKPVLFLKQFSCRCCHSRPGLKQKKQKHGNSISSPCTKTSLEELIAACLKHDNYALWALAPTLLNAPLSRLPPSPVLFSPDNPCLSSCRLTRLYLPPCHTLHHWKKKKSLIHIPPPPASTLLRGESTKAFCSSGDAARAVFLTAAYPPSPLLAKHRHQTVSIKPKQVPLTERPLFRLCGVHT